ncbi:MAG: fumarate hydratase [Candidatus Omnitrophota bacterium]
MKIISAEKIRDTVSNLCVQANLYLRKDVLSALKNAYKRETNKTSQEILKAIIDNAGIAKNEKLAICQDTGMPIVFVEAGQGVKINGDLKKAINKGVELGYKKASLRNSIVNSPLARNKSGYSPAVIHFDIVQGDKLKITVLPKGFGCENKTRLKMFKPTAGIEEIKRFIIDAVKDAGPDACPPYVVGVGIGGTSDYACLLAKKALLKKLYAKRYTLNAKLESDLLKEINNLNIGPMGLGGRNTCLGLNIQTYPTHIAGLPVCVNISCHALRSATVSL